MARAGGAAVKAALSCIDNEGLIDFKEGFGARAVVHDHYTIDLAGWDPGRLRRALR